MKKVWIILGIIVLAVGMFLAWKCWPVNYETISYNHREYRLGTTPAMTAQELKENSFGDAVATGVSYYGREIYVGGDTSPKYAGATHTVIFLKQKNLDFFDIYGLVGGP